MLLYLILCVFASASAQVTIDPGTLAEIFGTPPSTTPSSVPTTQKLEDITRGTTLATLIDKTTGEECKCVPYYLCNTDLVGVHSNNASVTGAGLLDIRFGEEDDCQESVERCCVNPKDPSEVPIPEPTADNLKGCGYRNKNGIDFFATGGSGSESQFGEFPWVVALLDARDSSYVGVGVLLHPSVVLTAAHLQKQVNNFSPQAIKVRAGEWDTQTQKERLPYQETTVQEAYIHSEYNSKSLRNDVMMLRLVEPFKLTDHINVICMPEQDELFEGYRDCVANGWGKNKFGGAGRYAVILKRVEIDMVNHQLCNDQLRKTRLGRRFILHDTFVCAGGDEGKDTCQGDGGAPLACPIGSDRYKLTGLVAWGIGCGQKDVPAVYVNVPKFRQWIDNKMAAWGYDTSGYTI